MYRPIPSTTCLLLSEENKGFLDCYPIYTKMWAWELIHHQKWWPILRMRLFHDIISSVLSKNMLSDWLYWYSILRDELPLWITNITIRDVVYHDKIHDILVKMFLSSLSSPFDIRYQAFLNIFEKLPVVMGINVIFHWLEKEVLSQHRQVQLLKLYMTRASEETMEFIMSKIDVFFKDNHHQFRANDRRLPVSLRSIRSNHKLSADDTTATSSVIEII